DNNCLDQVARGRVRFRGTRMELRRRGATRRWRVNKVGRMMVARREKEPPRPVRVGPGGLVPGWPLFLLTAAGVLAAWPGAHAAHGAALAMLGAAVPFSEEPMDPAWYVGRLVGFNDRTDKCFRIETVKKRPDGSYMFGTKSLDGKEERGFSWDGQA